MHNIGGNFVVELEYKFSCLFSLQFGEMNVWWARGENALAPPKKIDPFSHYQTKLIPIFSHLFFIVLIPPPSKWTLSVKPTLSLKKERYEEINNP